LLAADRLHWEGSRAGCKETAVAADRQDGGVRLAKLQW
jgi:hypothetical protein